MRQVQIIYPNLLDLLNEIVGNPGNEAFIAGLNQPDDDRFIGILGNIQAQIGEITQARDNLTLYPNYNQLEGFVDEIKNDFPGYNLARYNEIKNIIIISRIITDQIPDLTDPVDYDVTLFDFLEFQNSQSIPQKFYAFENGLNIQDSIILFSPTAFSTLDNDLRTSGITLQLLFILLSKIGQIGNALAAEKYILIRTGQAGLHKRIDSFLILHMVSDGMVVHEPRLYLNPPINTWKNEIRVGNKYQQFRETLDVISEFNYSKDIITKYLKIYQVIEEYMYKSQLVRLERDRNGQIFSLRDFKRMNEEVSEREITALKAFINKVFTLEMSPGVTFEAHFLLEWTNLVGVAGGYPTDTEINNVLQELKVYNADVLYTHGAINNQNIAKFVSTLIYIVRNSIVHNKSTEFHLTYRTLSNDIFILLEKYLIPNIERLFFYLTVKPASILVWFQNPSLQIWEDA